MVRVSALLIAALVAVSLSLGAFSVALADDYTCTGAVGAVTKDNIDVPDGASCTLTGTHVEGNIKVGTGSTLNASGVRVDGNIQAEGSSKVEVYGNSTVGGSIQIKQGGGAYVDRVDVDGDIQLESNAKMLEVNRNTVGGNVQVFSNSGGASITNNVIDGDLQCKQNNPAPTGGNNQAASFEDQCEGFDGTPSDDPPVVDPPPGGGGDDFVCRSAITGNTYENVVVPDFATCSLTSTTVNGNIIVGTGSTLNASGVFVDGNVQAEGSTKVTVQDNSTVGGNIQVKQGGGAFVDRANVDGDIQFESNTAELNASRNVVGGNIQVFSNSGGASITDNRIDGNLQCKSNYPPPIGARNQAASLEDQCSTFGGTPTNAPPVTDLTCQGTAGPETYRSVTVPQNARCTLNGTQVLGDIQVRSGAQLSAFSVTVDGSIQSQGAANVRVEGNAQAAASFTSAAVSTIYGSVQLTQGDAATLNGLQVKGDLVLSGNRDRVAVENTVVAGDLQAVNNTSTVVLRSNLVSGDLSCQGNASTPTGGDNLAAVLSGQCSALGAPLSILNHSLSLPSVFLAR